MKDALKATLPGEVFVKFVSKIADAAAGSEDNTKSCWVYLGPFENDRQTLEKMQPIQIPLGGGSAQAFVLSVAEIRECVKDLPARIRISRDRDLQTLRRQISALPLTLGGVPFKSVEHLRKCISEFLSKTPVGQALKPDSAAEKAVKNLLDYHPKAFMKRGGKDQEVVGIKVGLHEKIDSQTGEQTKCFYVLRKRRNAPADAEIEEEDFSVSKCLAELAKDPPCNSEELNALLRKRNETVAQMRAQANEQAAKRRKIREEADRITAAAPAATNGATVESEASQNGTSTEAEQNGTLCKEGADTSADAREHSEKAKDDGEKGEPSVATSC